MQEYPSDATMQLVNPQSTAPEEEKQQIKCPRCESANTKFCYYNNYNLSQPRHFCKDCRRYWTKGGSLRNVPVGGGIRKKTKRTYYSAAAAAAAAFDSKPKPLSSSALSDSPDPSSACFQPPKDPYSEMYPSIDQDDRMGEITGSFSSLLESDGNFRSLLDTHHLGCSRVEGLPTSSELNRSICAPGLELQSSNDSSGSENPTLQQDNFLSLQGDSSYWTWPDLAIYTPSSSFQ